MISRPMTAATTISAALVLAATSMTAILGTSSAAKAECTEADIRRMQDTLTPEDIARICGAGGGQRVQRGSGQEAVRPLQVGCVFQPYRVRFRCDEEVEANLTVEVISGGTPVPGAEVIIEGGGCAPPTRYEDFIRVTTDDRGRFETVCTFGLQEGACAHYDDVRSWCCYAMPAYVSARAPGYGEAQARCEWTAEVLGGKTE